MSFQVNQIFENTYPPEAAIWCNLNNAYIEEIEKVDDKRQFQIKAIPEKTLEELKQIKLDELTEKQREFEQNVCSEMKINSSLGYVMDADIRSQTNMQGLIDVGQFPVTYICGDNVARQLSLEDLQTVKKECILNGQNLYAQKWAYQEQISNAQTKEELEAIEISFVMLDFSVKDNSDEDDITQS